MPKFKLGIDDLIEEIPMLFVGIFPIDRTDIIISAPDKKSAVEKVVRRLRHTVKMLIRQENGEESKPLIDYIESRNDEMATS